MTEVRDLKVKLGRTTVVDDFEIFGILYGTGDGGSAWWIHASPISGGTSGSDYWIERGEFYHANSSVYHNMTNVNLTWTFGPATDIEPKLKAAISRAVADWETKAKAQGEA
ncbi:MAG TPA: hypothetical protein VFC29_16200 [Candidatus Limnocylindrales bacterium]|nr:hypothetical protein [Candidatus Limnocylindrales bacterium]